MKKIEISELSFNPFLKIRDQWALVASGNEQKFNMMTVNWGGLGELWFKEVTTVYVRKTRLTHDFIENNDYYTLIFLKDGNKSSLKTLGAKSGRDINKMTDSGLTPVFTPEGCPTFSEAELTFVCRKLYHADITRENFIDDKIFEKCYSDGNLHTMYIGEIVAVYQN